MLLLPKLHKKNLHWLILLLPGLLTISLAGCAGPDQMVAGGAASLMREVAAAVNQQSDIVLVRQGVPAYLLLIEGLVRKYPDNADLLLAGAQACGAYASLVEEGERAVRLYTKAKDYGLQALDRHTALRGFRGKPLDDFQQRLARIRKDDVPLLFGAGSAWGGWIANTPDSVEGMAELPWVEALMERVLQLDPDYYYGGAHLFKAILLSARPEQFGGNLKRADDHFQAARRIGGGKFFLTDVYYAQYYARQRLDRDLFEKTLKRVLETPADREPDLTLVNTLAQGKAKKLLDQIDEYF